MPYAVHKHGNRWAIINKKTKEIVGFSDTKGKAKSSVRARMGAEHGWKPTRRK